MVSSISSAERRKLEVRTGLQNSIGHLFRHKAAASLELLEVLHVHVHQFFQSVVEVFLILPSDIRIQNVLRHACARLRHLHSHTPSYRVV